MPAVEAMAHLRRKLQLFKARQPSLRADLTLPMPRTCSAAVCQHSPPPHSVLHLNAQIKGMSIRCSVTVAWFKVIVSWNHMIHVFIWDCRLMVSLGVSSIYILYVQDVGTILKILRLEITKQKKADEFCTTCGCVHCHHCCFELNQKSVTVWHSTLPFCFARCLYLWCWHGASTPPSGSTAFERLCGPTAAHWRFSLLWTILCKS